MERVCSFRLQFVALAGLALLVWLVPMDIVHAQNAQGQQQQQPASPSQPSGGGDADAKPYDTQIYQLAELLGAIHYLRELCGAEEGQVWRNQMRELVSGEGTTALRRARLVDSFNKGYRGYSRTYRTCTKPALVAIDRFLEQGASLTDTLMQNNR
jgi:uncharacterized protein (TIGR02301 family)